MGRALFGFVVTLGVVGIGCDGETTCPPDYPVERDGFCYRADGGAMMGMDAGAEGTDAGGGTDAGSAGGEDGGPSPDAATADAGGGSDDGGGVICTGTHPLLDGTRRYCESGDCFCADPDSCFPEAIADACCDVAVVCGDTDAGTPPDGGGVICTGTHPLVEGTRRYCEPGDCYCSDPDACYPAAIAAACCGVAVVCE